MGVGYFPTLYNDELVYSACARFHERVRHWNGKATLVELFGSMTASAVVGFPCRLNDLAAALPPGHGYSADRLIDQHTLLPLFTPFLPPERGERLKADMKGREGMAVNKRSGVMASHIPSPERLRYCPLCKEDDEQKVREAYWHRTQQAPGVEVCPEHYVFLEKSDVPIRHLSNPFRFTSIGSSRLSRTARPLDFTDRSHQILLEVARNTSWLLRQRGLKSNLKALHNRYLSLLIARGLATYSGCIHVRKLLRGFDNHFPAPLLSFLGCEFSGRDQEKSNWLLRLVREPKNAQHPLRHLLLLSFLGISAELFFRLPEEINYFGDTPWPCLNPAATHYGEPKITSHSVSYRGKENRPVGTFRCECGFTYARTGPDRLPEDRLRISRMKEFGGVWEKELERLWRDPSSSVTAIARRLCVDPLTVRRHAERLQLHWACPGKVSTPLKSELRLKAEDSVAVFRSRRRENRAKWLSAIRCSPKMTMKSLRRRLPRVYAWLVSNDPEWLKSHRPPPRKRARAPSGVDWKRRDVKLAALVREAASRMITAPGRPRRITKTAVARKVGHVTLLQQKINKLPLTAQVLSGVVESRVDFAVRRVRWAEECYFKEGFMPKRWQLLLRANVYSLRGAPQVKKAIDLILERLSDLVLQSVGSRVKRAG